MAFQRETRINPKVELNETPHLSSLTNLVAASGFMTLVNRSVGILGTDDLFTANSDDLNPIQLSVS
jgi:hypothetical protein